LGTKGKISETVLFGWVYPIYHYTLLICSYNLVQCAYTFEDVYIVKYFVINWITYFC